MSGSPSTCPNCGAAINADLLGGLCPACVQRMALASEAGVNAGAETEITPADEHPPCWPPAREPAAAWSPPELEEIAALLPQGDYAVERIVGRGGMGAVYQGVQVRLQRPVAIKIMRRDFAGDHGFAERFRREALAMAELSHPNVVNVIDCGEAGPDFLYIVMEYVDGVDLLQVIRSGGMTQAMALALVPQICDALQFAHDHGIVHRDVKPSNILVTRDGRIKIADFGLAKRLADGSDPHTRTGVGMGTPDYAAPEQFETGAEVDHRADIYALGVMIYQMLTGQLPRGAWKPPSKSARVRPEWDAIVSHAMQQKPGDRYASAVAVKSDVARIGTPSVPLWRKQIVLTAAALLVLGAGAALAFWKRSHALPPAPAAGAQAAAEKPVVEKDGTLVFRGHSYQFVPGMYSWDFAKAQAERMGGHLATITSEEEHAVLDVAFGRFLSAKYWSAWIGAHRPDKKSPWQWITGEPMTFTQWRKGADDPDAVPVSVCLFHPDQNSPNLIWLRVSDEPSGSAAWRGYIVEWDGERPAESSVKASHIAATKAAPFVNSLGMKFVPAATLVSGDAVLFSIYETRNHDYAAFAAAAARPSADASWKNVPGLDNGAEHPVLMVNWEDAITFCDWLTDTERAKGAIGPQDSYRLPTDIEWSAAAGLRGEGGDTPAARSAKAAGYPWGSAWPPPEGAGNFHDETAREQFTGNVDRDGAELARHLKGAALTRYRDGFPLTAPVGRFAANQLGLHDLAGNVEEPCADFFGGTEPRPFNRVMRGGAWDRGGDEAAFRTSVRWESHPLRRYPNRGFRVVLQLRRERPKTTAADAIPAAPPAPPAGMKMENERTLIFGGRRYEFVPALLTWEQSRVEAERRGGHLATITSKAENDALIAAFNKYLGTHANVWLGGIKESEEAPWKWITGEPFEFTDWDTGAPISKTFPSRLHIWRRVPSVATFNWHDYSTPIPFPEVWRGFLIEWESEIVPPPKTGSPVTATRDAPFVNSLGMNFVPVATTADGHAVHFSVWETRNRDYAVYASDAGRTRKVDMSWQNVPLIENGHDHPVVMINWADAVAFCHWLTDHERAKKTIGPYDIFRLPADLEWSAAVGLKNETGATPGERHLATPGNPWGEQWPPPDGFGNFADESARAFFDEVKNSVSSTDPRAVVRNIISGYRDPFPGPAPVGSFKANALGIHDLSGNASEWCSDLFEPGKSMRVLRGGSWMEGIQPGILASASRFDGNPPPRYPFRGIRVVLEVAAGK